VVLLGRIQSGRDNTTWLAPDKNESLAKADQFETDLLKMADNYIAQAGLDNPPESLPVLRDGFEAEEITELDLKAAGITTIIWAMGYRFNFDLVKFPVFDNEGFPVHTRGVTAYPGLYFVGLPWLSKQKSGYLVGVGEDAEFLAAKISSDS
jgi:putative flavoprotein involved in K+ transport